MAALSRSPTCGPRIRRRRRRRCRTCSSAARRRRAPAPRTAGATSIARGTYPRARRSTAGRPAITRATESSQRRLDVAIVQQKQVGDAAQPLQRVVVAKGDRLVGQVAGGHDQRPAASAAADGGAACTAASGRRAGCRARRRRQRPSVAPAAPARSAARPTSAARSSARSAPRGARASCEVAHHDRERLLVAALARAAGARRRRATVASHAR